jgi:hypothetical protein
MVKSPGEPNSSGGILDRLRCKILLLGVFSLLVVSLPSASALPPCLVQSVKYDFPSSAAPEQQITVKTQLMATCIQWPPYRMPYSIRVDLTDLATGAVASVSYQVGYAQTYIDQVFQNNARAPNSPGAWLLRVDVYIWGGSGQLLVHMADYAKLPVQ